MLAPTIEQLRSIALDADDATGYFAAMYARMTDRVQHAISDGRFDDGERMGRFAVRFAAWYVEPRTGVRPTPRCWNTAVDTASDSRVLIVQHLLLGINAHVNHDLPQVVVELAEEQPTSPDETDPHRRLNELNDDFNAINELLAETQPMVLRDLGRASAWSQRLAAAGGGRLFDFSLDRARDQAWNNAVEMSGLDLAAREHHAARIDGTVDALAQLVLTRPAFVSWLLNVARWLEDDDPRTVTRTLLGHLA